MINDLTFTVELSRFKTPPRPRQHIGQLVKSKAINQYGHLCTFAGIITGMSYVSSEFDSCNYGQWWRYTVLIHQTDDPLMARLLPFTQTIEDDGMEQYVI